MSPKQDSLPNLFLPGARKAGTTALAAALGKHPDIFVAPHKEPMFFAQRPESSERLDRLLSPHGPGRDALAPTRIYDHLDFETYAELFAPGKSLRYRVDASATYLPSPDAIALASSASPDALFITILRDPYERAYSAFQYNRSRRREPALTFPEAIEHERAGKRRNWAYGWRYMNTSLYADQIERLFETIPEANRLVMTMGELLAPDGLTRVFAFLELESQAIALEKENVTRVPSGRAALAAAQLLNDNRIGRVLRRFLPQVGIRTMKSLVGTMRNFAYRNAVPPPVMADADKMLIADKIEPDIDRLERLLGRDLSDWRHRPQTSPKSSPSRAPENSVQTLSA